MTAWPDPSRLPELLGDAMGPLAGVAACVVIVVRDLRLRRRRARLAAMRLAWRPDACDPIPGKGDTVRMTLLADVNEAGEVERAEAWLHGHRDRLTYLSGQGGCGCCVVDWDMEGPREVIQTLPNGLRCGSDWTRGERGRAAGPPRCDGV